MKLFEKEKATTPVYKYYMEVLGGSKELYTVKATEISIDSCGCYVFMMNEDVVASYPINKTIIKSIELKSEE